MKPILFPALLAAALLLLLCFSVLATKSLCPVCGGPVYLFFLSFCPCG